MENKGYYRGDIWYAKLDNIGIEDHPILIVSNWKSNSKKKDVNILVISSQLDKNIANSIEIEGYGLDKKSKIIVSNIRTLNKSQLTYKIGHVPENKMLEIDKKLEKHLELGNRYYSNIKEDDLENFFINKINEETQNERIFFQNSKIKLWNLYLNKKYKNAIEESVEIEHKAEKSKLEDKNKYIYYALHIRTLCCIKENNFEDGLAYGKKSLIYIGNPNNFNKDYAMIIWTIARCYEGINDIEKAKKNYSILIKYYKQIGDINGRISCLFNYSKLNNNIKAMIKIRNILSCTKVNNQNFYNKEEYKQEILKQMNTEINDFLNRL